MRLKSINRRSRFNHFSKTHNDLYWRLLSKREKKKYHNRIQKYWEQYRKSGAIFHSCSLHPCFVTELDIENDSITGKSLLDGSTQECSMHNCGVYLMRQGEIDSYKEAWTRDGERGILTVYYGSEAAADAFIKEWKHNG